MDFQFEAETTSVRGSDQEGLSNPNHVPERSFRTGRNRTTTKRRFVGVPVRLYRAHALKVRVGGSPRLFVTLSTGRNEIVSCSLRFSSPELSINVSNGVCSGEQAEGGADYGY